MQNEDKEKQEHIHDHDAQDCGLETYGHDHEEHSHAHEEHDHCHEHEGHDHNHEGHDHCDEHEDHDHGHEEHDHEHHGHDHEHHHHDHEHEHHHTHDHEHHHHDHSHTHGDAAESLDYGPEGICDECGELAENCHCAMPKEGWPKAVFIVEGLDCADGAAEIERAIAKLPAVKEASLVYTTGQLRIVAKNPLKMLPALQRIAGSIEDEAIVIPRSQYYSMKKGASHDEHDGAGEGHEHGHDGHDHNHEHEHGEGGAWERYSLVIGGVLFAALETYATINDIEEFPLPLVAVLVFAYVILGFGVLKTAFKNMLKGRFFDENFLMSIATLGALVMGEYPEATGVMLFFRIGEAFEEIAVARSRGQIMEAVDLRPEVVNIVKGDDVQEIPAEEAHVGDTILVRPGDRVPLDGVILDGETQLDTSAVTGEPVPVKVGVGSDILSGCVNVSGAIKVKVTKPLEESMVSRILESVENAASSKPKIDTFITRFSGYYTPIVVLLALVTAFVIPTVGNMVPAVGEILAGTHNGLDYHNWIYTALSFLVMSCPCALVLSVPLAFFCGIGAGSKQGILFKGGVAMEALSKVKAVVMDKTGTITKGNFVVQDVKVECNPPVKESELLGLAASCELASTHPIGVSIVLAAKERGYKIARPEKVEELSGHGIRAEINGHVILCGNMKLMDEFKVDTTNYRREASGSEVLVVSDGIYLGHIVISDTIKEDAKEAIARLKADGIRTIMLTGDAQADADAVAAATGIDEVHAKLLPQDKLTQMQKIRATRGATMFVGDGINDAPVLAGADVGAAMGSGADAAIEAADVVFMNSTVDSIPAAMKMSRRTMSVANQNVWFALAIKIIVMLLGVTGIYSNMWLAVFADTGVAFLCILNSVRILYTK